KRSAEILNVKRRITRGQCRICETADRSSRSSELVNGAAKEIGGENLVFCCCDRQTFIHRVGYARELLGISSERASPSVDGAVFRCEEKHVAVERSGSVEHLSGNR